MASVTSSGQMRCAPRRCGLKTNIFNPFWWDARRLGSRWGTATSSGCRWAIGWGDVGRLAVGVVKLAEGVLAERAQRAKVTKMWRLESEEFVECYVSGGRRPSVEGGISGRNSRKAKRLLMNRVLS